MEAVVNTTETETGFPSKTNYSDSNHLVIDALDRLQLYVVSISEVTEIGRKFIAATNELKSLKQIRRTLSVRSKNEIKAQKEIAPAKTIPEIDSVIPDILKCPVCLEVFDKEIIQCLNGHSVCSQCSTEISQCPVCRAEYDKGMVRNRAVEEIVRTFQLDCVYHEAGCRKRFVYSDLQAHVDACPFMKKPRRSPEYIAVRDRAKAVFWKERRMEKRLREATMQYMNNKTAWHSARDALYSRELDTTIINLLVDSFQSYELHQRELDLEGLLKDLYALVN